MAQPNWDEIAVDYDVLIAWRQLAKDAAYNFRFALNRTVDHPGDDIYQPDSNPHTAVSLQGTYDGNLVKISPIRYSVGPKIRSKIIFPTVTITLARDNSEAISDLLTALEDSNNFGDYDVHIPIFVTRKGVAVNPDTDVAYVGIPNPTSVKIHWDRIEITMSDAMEKFDVALHENFNTTLWPDMDPSWENKPVPIMYGRFGLSATGSPITARLFFDLPCVDTNLKWFQICSPGTNGIKFNESGSYSPSIFCFGADGNLKATYDSAIQNDNCGSGSDTSHDGIFRINSIFTWEEGDKFYLHSALVDLFGNLDSGGLPLENPADIWYGLLTEYAGVSNGSIDSDWTDVRDYFNDLPNPYKARRFLREHSTLISALEELCGDFGMMTFIKSGKFALKLNRIHDEHPVRRTLNPHDFLKGKFKYVCDEGRERANGARLYFRWDQGFNPTKEELEQIGDELGVPAYSGYSPPHESKGNHFFGKTISPMDENDYEEYSSKWIWKAEDAISIAGKIKNAITADNEPSLSGVNATVIKRLLDPARSLGDVYLFRHLAINQLDKTVAAQVYEQNDDLMKGTTSIKANAAITE